MALALVRYRSAGGATNLLIFLPMATPEIVHGLVAPHAVPQPGAVRASSASGSASSRS
jgi:ABC-type spermidine/putrescine transport system permease subunit II